MNSTDRSDNPRTPLFRQEAIDAQKPRQFGTVLIVPRRSAWAMAVFSIAVFGGLIAFVTLGSYTRRVTVAGQLVPAGGVIRIQTPQPGVVLERRIEEGQWVNKGDVLYVLTSDRPGLGLEDLQGKIGARVGERRQSLELEIERNRTVMRDELDSLKRRSALQSDEAVAIRQMIEQQRARLLMAEQTRARYQELADKDYVAREQLVQKELDVSEQQSRLKTLERDLLATRREQAATLRDIDSTGTRYRNQISLLERSISLADQESTEVESRRRVIITAPEAGRATVVIAEPGHAVDVSRSLAMLVPEQAGLEARLYAPSRAIGFVKSGDTVLLRYQAFPYQKFGHQRAVVKSVSAAVVATADLPAFPLPDALPGEPVYAVTAALEAIPVLAYGQPVSLRAGMRVDADIVQETRPLYEWVLEPLYSVTGRLRK